MLATLRVDLKEAHLVSRREFLQQDDYRLCGLFKEGQIVGVARVVLYPHIGDGRNCWIYVRATHPAQHAKGFGPRLMRFMAGWVKEQGCARLCVHTRL